MKKFENEYEKKLYKCWADIKTRCFNPKCKRYKDYGGRGITMCERWQTWDNFKEDLWDSFLKHIEEYGIKQTTLDRNKVNLNYEPSNCSWETYKKQRMNIRVKGEYEITNLKTGEVVIVNNLTEWCEPRKMKRSHCYKVMNGEWSQYNGYTFKMLKQERPHNGKKFKNISPE